MSGPRLGAAIALSVVGLVTAVFLLSREVGPFRLPGAEPLLLVDASATALDTVSLRGRRVTATLNGTVVENAPDGSVWLETGEDAFRLTFPEAVDVAVEDRILAVGRLRGRGGRRWVEVTAWSVVDGHVDTAPIRRGL